MFRRCAVLVDAGYLYKAAGKLILNRDCRREELVLDGGAMLTLLDRAANDISGGLLLRVYWYDAARRGPTPAQLAIADLPHVKLRLGQLNAAQEQKGVDPLIIMDMITLARNHACEEMVLLSGDADLIIGVLQAQEHGVRVHLLGVPPSRGNQAPSLRQEADTTSELSLVQIQSVFANAQIAAHPNTPVSAAPGVTAAPAGPPTAVTAAPVVTEPQLRSVAEAVDDALNAIERASVVAASVVPGEIDRRLFGTAKSMLSTMLAEADKRTLRRLFREACQRRR